MSEPRLNQWISNLTEEKLGSQVDKIPKDIEDSTKKSFQDLLKEAKKDGWINQKELKDIILSMGKEKDSITSETKDLISALKDNFSKRDGDFESQFIGDGIDFDDDNSVVDETVISGDNMDLLTNKGVSKKDLIDKLNGKKSHEENLAIAKKAAEKMAGKKTMDQLLEEIKNYSYKDNLDNDLIRSDGFELKEEDSDKSETILDEEKTRSIKIDTENKSNILKEDDTIFQNGLESDSIVSHNFDGGNNSKVTEEVIDHTENKEETDTSVTEEENEQTKTTINNIEYNNDDFKKIVEEEAIQTELNMSDDFTDNINRKLWKKARDLMKKKIFRSTTLEEYTERIGGEEKIIKVQLRKKFGKVYLILDTPFKDGVSDRSTKFPLSLDGNGDITQESLLKDIDTIKSNYKKSLEEIKAEKSSKEASEKKEINNSMLKNAVEVIEGKKQKTVIDSFSATIKGKEKKVEVKLRNKRGNTYIYLNTPYGDGVKDFSLQELIVKDGETKTLTRDFLESKIQEIKATYEKARFQSRSKNKKKRK